MRPISAEAGVAVGLANYHFGSRRELPAEVLANSREHFVGDFDVHLPEGGGPDAFRRMSELAAALVDLMHSGKHKAIEVEASGRSRALKLSGASRAGSVAPKLARRHAELGLERLVEGRVGAVADPCGDLAQRQGRAREVGGAVSMRQRAR